MEWKNEELYIITLRWKDNLKSYTLRRKGEHGKRNLESFKRH